MRSFWQIYVNGWGVLYAIGTEREAEAWRVSKAQRLQTLAHKQLIAAEDIPEGEEFLELRDLL